MALQNRVDVHEETIRAGGVTLPVLVYRPQDSRPAPAVIVCSGGIQKGNFEVLDWMATRLQAAGFVALAISYRDGSPLHDPDDISLALDWLEADPSIHGGAIGIMGMSRGGGAALRGAALDARLKAVVTFGPVTNLIQQLEGTAVYAPNRHRLLLEWLGDPVKDRAFYEKVQAISYADRIKQPVLMVHGAHDMHAPPEQSIWMKEAIEAGGNADVRLELIPMMCHYGDVIPNRFAFDELGELIVPFFKKRLTAAAIAPEVSV